jgi:hypothetical protein
VRACTSIDTISTSDLAEAEGQVLSKQAWTARFTQDEEEQGQIEIPPGDGSRCAERIPVWSRRTYGCDGMFAWHLAVAIELSAFVQHQTGRADGASQPSGRQQFDSLARNDFAINLPSNRQTDRGNPRSDDRARGNCDLVSGDFSFGLTFNSRWLAKIQLARDFGPLADAGLK